MNVAFSELKLPSWDAHHSLWGMAEKYRLGYIKSKYNLAMQYEPKRICEIGVYAGIAARCFLFASPNAFYLGIDNKEAENNQGISLVEPAYRSLLDSGYNAKLLIADSQTLTELPDGPFDFIHVDGNHETMAAKHDIELAWQALVPEGVLLVDDCHNMQVVAGVALALQPLTDLLDWSYHDDGVGTMVIHKRQRIR